MAPLRRHWPVLLVVLFPLIPLWRAVFLGEAIGPFDQIRQMAPWNGPAPDRPFDVLQADAVLQFYPWRDMVFEAWGKGQLPLWNPYQLAGTPLLANSQSAGFYPPHILMGALHVPTHWAITLLAWFHLAWAGLGVMALARRLGATPAGGAIGGVLFSGSAFMLAWTALPSVISTCAWIPWVLAGVYGLFEGDGRTTQDDLPDRNASAPQSRKSAIPQYLKFASGLAFCTAMMLLAGHLQFAFYGLLAAGFVLLARFAGEWSAQRSNRTTATPLYRYTAIPFITGLLALALGAGMAAPQLLPVLEYSQFSHRRNVPTEEGYRAYVAGAIAPYELVGLIYPTAVGLPYEFAPEHKPLSQYWPALVKPGANFAEGAIGIGPLALFGLLMFPWRSHAKRLWLPLALLAGFAFLMALGTILNKPFYFLIPGWSSTGSPGRVGVLFVMGACVLAAVGIPGRAEPRSFRRVAGVALIPTVLSLVTYWITGTAVGSLESGTPNMTEVLHAIGKATSEQVVNISLLVVAAYGVLDIPLLDKRRKALSPWWFFVTMSVAQLFALGSTWVCQIPTSTPITPSDTGLAIAAPAGGRIAAINEPWALVVAAPATLPPNTASLLRLHDLAGYDSLLHQDTQQFLTDVNGQDPAPPANGNIQYVKPSAEPAKLAEAGVSTVLSRRPVFPNLVPKTLPNGLLEYALGGQRAYLTHAGDQPLRALSITDGYDRQTITGSLGPGLLVVKDRLMPGWTAFVDGKATPWSERSPVWKAPDGREVRLWRAVDLPEGEHRVEFRYDPPGLKKGLWIMLPCLFVCLSAAGAARAGRRKPTSAAAS